MATQRASLHRRRFLKVGGGLALASCGPATQHGSQPRPSNKAPPAEPPAAPQPEPSPATAPVPAFDRIIPAGHLLSRRRLDPAVDLDVPDAQRRFDVLHRVELHAIEYDSAGVRVEGFVVVAPGAPPSPTVVYARGGGAQPRARIGAAMLAKHLAPLALAGFTVVGTQYRAEPDGHDEFGGQELEDLVHLRAVVAELPEAADGGVGVLGWSRGAMMVHLALAHAPTAFAAAVAAAGASDQAAELSRRPAMQAVFAAQVPGFDVDRAAALARRSPASWAERIPTDVPILLLHGTQDVRVSPTASLEMAGRFQELGVPYRLVMFDGGGHGIFEHEREVQTQIAQWFRRHLA